MPSLRRYLAPLAAALVLVAPALAGPPTTWPATYDASTRVRETIHVSAAGRSITRRETFESSGPLTFLDERRLSLDSGDDVMPDFTAKYETNRRGVVHFRLDRASRRFVDRYFRRQMRGAGMQGACGTSFGVGTIEFSEDGSSLEGRQTMRLWLDGTYRGVGVEMDAVARFTFTGTRAP